MTTLAETHPDVLAEFKSAMALDQSHEQNNEMVKGSDGAIGLTGNFQEHSDAGW